MPELVGSDAKQLVDWLCKEWWEESPGVCIVEGFPGVGKTRVAEEVAERLSNKSVCTAWAEYPESRTGALDDLAFVLAESFAQVGDERVAETLDLEVVPEILNTPTLLVIDEFQRSLRNGKPEKGLTNWLKTLSGTKGRVLLLSSQDVDEGLSLIHI